MSTASNQAGIATNQEGQNQLRLVWLTSARDEAAVVLLRDVLAAGISIAAVGCDNEAGPYIDVIRRICEAHRVSLTVRSPDPITPDEQTPELKRRRREEYDSALASALAADKSSCAVLVGYMRLVSRAFTSRFGAVLNLHPSPPRGPKGTWQDVVWTLIAIRARLTGGMIHLATDNLDRGPVIAYYTVSTMSDDLRRLWERIDQSLAVTSLEELIAKFGEREPLFEAVRRVQFEREAPLLVHTLRSLQTGALQLIDFGNQGVRYRDTVWRFGVRFNNEVEELLRTGVSTGPSIRESQPR